MKTLFSSDDIITILEAKKRLSHELKTLPRILSTIGTIDKILRIEIACEPIDPLTWLHNQTSSTKYYWSNRDGSFAMAGLGLADSVEAKQTTHFDQVYSIITKRLSSDNPRLRYYGHLMFDTPKSKEEWTDFKPLTFVLPRFEIFQDNLTKGTHLVCNIAFCDISEENINHIIKELDVINFASTTQYRRPPQVTQRIDTPSKEEWTLAINKTLKNIKSKTVSKVVLARRSDFTFDMDIRPAALIKHLKDRSHGCYHFCFSPTPQVAFLGASPECLLVENEKNIKTEALAGTSKNNAKLSESETEKIAREHDFVVQFIAQQLANSGCTHIKQSQRTWANFNEAKHLRTEFSAQKSNKTNLPELIKNLHPTPAVGGVPKENALNLIKSIEPFSRGCYAGPIGWLGYDTAEFALGIRSALVNNAQLSLFAGAGIVDGSIAENEWNEVEQKISNFIDVFKK